VTFDVRATQPLILDGNGPMPAGTKVNIHTNSDALDTTSAKPLKPGDFDQVASASSSTEVAADGEEVDVFYRDGVNWPAANGSRAQDCLPATPAGWRVHRQLAELIRRVSRRAGTLRNPDA